MVGLICTSVFGTKPDPRAREYAIDMGIALQIVNIMRDVKEDAERGRVYFSAEDLAAHGLTADDILRVQLRRAVRRDDAAAGRARARVLSPRQAACCRCSTLRSRMCVNVMQGVYAEILSRIEARNYDVLTRARQPLAERSDEDWPALAAGSMVRPQDARLVAGARSA